MNILLMNIQNNINFHHLTIVKRQNKNQFYGDVCLTLDDDDQLCTPNDYGFDISSNSSPFEIDFVLPKQNIQKLQLSFNANSPTDGSGNILGQVQDLKIYYKSTQKIEPGS